MAAGAGFYGARQLNETQEQSVRPESLCDGNPGSSSDNQLQTGEEEEATIPVAQRIPEEPTAEERLQHMLTHIPYRQWCQHCVAGKAKGGRHEKSSKYTREVPTVVLDYMYMRDTQQDGEEGGMPILVGYDTVTARGGTGTIFARVVPAKGVNEYAVKVLANELS